jgi:zinc transport system substrate-binding protein
MKKIFILLILLLLILFTFFYVKKVSDKTSKKKPSLSPKTEQITVFATILPLKYFVDQIVKNMAKTHVLIKPNQNPETFDPSIKDLCCLKSAKIYFQIGFSIEDKLISKIKQINPKIEIINLSKNVETIKHKNEIDSHIWTSPIVVKKMSRTILDAFLKIDPKNTKFYQKNYQEFITKLDNLNTYIKNELSTFGGRDFLVFHPAWGYFAKEYNLRQRAIEKHGKEPNIKDFENIINFAKKNHINTLFIQDQHSTKQAQNIAKILNAKVVNINPLAYDYVKNMYFVTDQIKRSFDEPNN